MSGRRPVSLDASPSLPPLGADIEFMRLVLAVEHGFERASKRMAAASGVTRAQRLVLHIVGRFPGVSAGQLASALQIHPSTLTGVLCRLERRRLIDRRPDPRDSRRAAFGLTAAGRRLDVSLLGAVEPAIRQVLSDLPPGQLRAAEDVLARLARALGVTAG